MDVPTKRIAVLDEWRFDQTVLRLATRFLWFEGKPVVVNRPQNPGAVGHLLYTGTAPIFITTKQQYFDDLVAEARHAEVTDGQSEATMLLRRLELFLLAHKLPAPPAWIRDCPCCFARTVIQHASVHHQALFT